MTISFLQLPKSLFLCFLILTFTSCFKRVNVSTNTYADVKKIPQGFAPGSSFCVASAKNDNQVLSKEIAYKIEEILKDGQYIIKDRGSADYYLLFDYGIKTEQGKRTVPIYTPGGIQTTQGNVQRYGSSYGQAVYQETTTLPGTTTYLEQQYTFFVRSLTIQVYDAKLYRSKKQEDQIWYGAAVSLGESCDLRFILDYLFAAIFPYFGKDTKRTIETSLGTSDETVEKFRKIYHK